MKKHFLVGCISQLLFLSAFSQSFDINTFFKGDKERISKSARNDSLIVHVDFENKPVVATIIRAIDSFLVIKNSPIEIAANEKDFSKADKHTIDTDIKLWQTPFYELAEIKRDYETYFDPVIEEIVELAPRKKYLIRLVYSPKNSSKNVVGCSYNFIANYDNVTKRVLFERYTNWYIKDWYKEQIGNILFYKESREEFNKEQALQSNQFNDSLANVFGVAPVKIVYFSCKNLIQIFHIKGYEFVYNMFLAKTGGMINYGGKGSTFENIVYSGNNKEYYPHEIAHFYINQFSNPYTSKLASEGIATFIGGSSELPLSHHLAALNKFINQDSLQRTLVSFLSNDMRIPASESSTLYTLGGLIARILYEKNGLQGFKDFLEIPQTQLNEGLAKLFDVKVDGLENYLRNQLKQSILLELE